jgi:hypothetical protein
MSISLHTMPDVSAGDSRMRSARSVSTWNVPIRATHHLATSSMNASEITVRKRSLIELTKTIRGLVHERFRTLSGTMRVEPLLVRVAGNASEIAQRMFLRSNVRSRLIFRQPRTGFHVVSVHSIFEF